jgi:hypothetical protein
MSAGFYYSATGGIAALSISPHPPRSFGAAPFEPPGALLPARGRLVRLRDDHRRNFHNIAILYFK